MKKIVHIAAALVITTLFLSGAQGWSQTGSLPADQMQGLTFAGSGVNLGITRLLAEGFVKAHPQVAIKVPGSIGTRGAIKAVADGAIALGLISRSLSEEEKAQGIVARPYARVAIIIGAHPSVPDKNITSQDLIEIFKGTKTQWQDGKEIIVLAREKSDSGFSVLENNLPGFREVYQESQAAKRWTLYFTDQEANRALSSTPNALGITDLGMISTEHLPIKTLKFNAIEPGPDTLRNGTYPLSRTLSFIYREEKVPEGARDFLDFVFSDEGRSILEAHGYLSIQ